MAFVRRRCRLPPCLVDDVCPDRVGVITGGPYDVVIDGEEYRLNLPDYEMSKTKVTVAQWNACSRALCELLETRVWSSGRRAGRMLADSLTGLARAPSRYQWHTRRIVKVRAISR